MTAVAHERRKKPSPAAPVVARRTPTRAHPDLVLAGIAVGAAAVIGPCERGDHVLDPFTRRPATGVSSVTVVGKSLTYADAFATAALAMGTEASVWLTGLVGCGGFVVANDGALSATADSTGHDAVEGHRHYTVDQLVGVTPREVRLRDEQRSDAMHC